MFIYISLHIHTYIYIYILYICTHTRIHSSIKLGGRLLNPPSQSCASVSTQLCLGFLFRSSASGNAFQILCDVVTLYMLLQLKVKPRSACMLFDSQMGTQACTQ